MKLKIFFTSKLKKGDKMVTRLDLFKDRMEPAKEIYSKELKEFSKNYDFLGNITLTEKPDIDTLDYIFSFENLNGTSEDILDEALCELCKHMDDFSKANGIDEFSRNATILYKR